jgi:hypothetical protein
MVASVSSVSGKLRSLASMVALGPDAVLILMQGGCVAAHLHGHLALNDEAKWGCKIGKFVSLSLLPFSCSIFVPE